MSPFLAESDVYYSLTSTSTGINESIKERPIAKGESLQSLLARPSYIPRLKLFYRQFSAFYYLLLKYYKYNICVKIVDKEEVER